MKKFLMGIFMALLSVFAFAEADYHIGIVTGTVSHLKIQQEEQKQLLQDMEQLKKEEK